MYIFVDDLCRDVAGNDFEGSVPSELGRLTALQYLELQRNKHMSGAMPTQLGNLSGLLKL